MPRGKLLSEFQKEEIIRRYAAGETRALLAKDFDVTWSAIDIFLRRRGLLDKSKNSITWKLSDSDRNKIVHNFLNGTSPVELSMLYGVNRTSIYKLLERRGVYTSSEGKKLTKFQKQEIVNKFLTGDSPVPISKQLNVSLPTVHRILRNKNLITGSMKKGPSPIHAVNHDALSDLSKEEAAYWCGFIFADGCVHKKINNTSIVKVGLSTKDYDHVVKFRRFFGSSQKIGVTTKLCQLSGNSFPFCSVQIASDQLSNKLLDCGRYSGDLHPELFASRHFWRGVIDGDGSVAIRRSRNSLYPFVWLCGSFWIVDAFKRRWALSGHDSKAGILPQVNIFNYGLHGRYAVDCIRWLYGDATVYLDRKYETAQRILAEYG